MAGTIAAYYHPGMAAPLGHHIMPIRKFGLVADALCTWPEVTLIEPEPVTLEQLSLVHTREYIEAVRTGEPKALAESQKFPWSPELYGSVCLTNGGCLSAARRALEDGVSAALVSGFHHACSDHGEGFCTFNGLVVTADDLRHSGAVDRVAVLDLDLHYGNGTAQLAEGRPHLLTVSVYGNDYWGNVAYSDVTTRRHEDGPNHLSFSLPQGCDRATLLRTLEQALEAVAHFEPSLILYQAGADPYFEDPYSPLALDHGDLLARDERVLRFARDAGIPIAWVLAGGYTKDIAKIVAVHVNTFAAWRTVFC